jgi:hypothetical protein
VALVFLDQVLVEEVFLVVLAHLALVEEVDQVLVDVRASVVVVLASAEAVVVSVVVAVAVVMELIFRSQDLLKKLTQQQFFHHSRLLTHLQTLPSTRISTKTLLPRGMKSQVRFKIRRLARLLPDKTLSVLLTQELVRQVRF